MTLPNLQITYSCGACGEELDHDGDTLVCYPCGLDYAGDPTDRPEATFLEDVQPCGYPNDNTSTRRLPWRTVNGTVEEWRTVTITYEPCSLPSTHPGHGGFHWHHPRRTYVYDTGAQA